MLQDVQMEGYEALESIGSGSFGMIRKVRRKIDGQILARKEIDFRKMNNKEKEQLVAEVNILKDLKHPNIVQFLERVIDREHSFIYILMEYCEGGDLASVIKRHKDRKMPIQEDFVWKLTAQLISALHECHCGLVLDEQSQKMVSRQILHRDLKPDNVFLDGKKNVKLGDFGLSRSLSDPKLTFAKTYVGTPYYMSPELLSESLYDAKSDIWSLGCVIYEMCALEPPFLADSQAALTAKIKYGMVSRIPGRYSDELNQVIRSMLQVDPRRRPSTTELLALPKMSLYTKQIELDQRLEEVKASKMHLIEQEGRLMIKENMLRDTEAALRAAEQTLREKETDLNAREEIIISRESSYGQKEEYLRVKELSLVEWEQKLSQERRHLEESRRELIREYERAQSNGNQSDAHMLIDSKDQSTNGMSSDTPKSAPPRPYWTAPVAKPNIFSTISKATGNVGAFSNTHINTNAGTQDHRLSLRGWETGTAGDQSGSRTLPRRKTALSVGRHSLQPTSSSTLRNRNPSGPTDNGAASLGTTESGSVEVTQNSIFHAQPPSHSKSINGATRTQTSQLFPFQGINVKESRLSSRLSQGGVSAAGPSDSPGMSGAQASVAADIRKFRGKTKSASSMVAQLSLSSSSAISIVTTPPAATAGVGQESTNGSTTNKFVNGSNFNFTPTVFSTFTTADATNTSTSNQPTATTTTTSSNTPLSEDLSLSNQRSVANTSSRLSNFFGGRLNQSASLSTATTTTTEGSSSKNGQGSQPLSGVTLVSSNANQSYLSRRLNASSTTSKGTSSSVASIRFQPQNHPRPATAQAISSTVNSASYFSASQSNGSHGPGSGGGSKTSLEGLGGSVGQASIGGIGGITFTSTSDQHSTSSLTTTTPKKFQSRTGGDNGLSDSSGAARSGSPPVDNYFKDMDNAMDWDDIPSPFIKKPFMRPPQPPSSSTKSRNS
ncbi:hypothetical protein BGZ83_002588 [Gryganskiella cystojenkinii]|nr:hypothetical protein BGZ83_002588 [Gryganskiella cystojenkinii]